MSRRAQFFPNREKNRHTGPVRPVSSGTRNPGRSCQPANVPILPSPPPAAPQEATNVQTGGIQIVNKTRFTIFIMFSLSLITTVGMCSSEQARATAGAFTIAAVAGSDNASSEPIISLEDITKDPEKALGTLKKINIELDKAIEYLKFLRNSGVMVHPSIFNVVTARMNRRLQNLPNRQMLSISGYTEKWVNIIDETSKGISDLFGEPPSNVISRTALGNRIFSQINQVRKKLESIKAGIAGISSANTSNNNNDVRLNVFLSLLSLLASDTGESPAVQWQDCLINAGKMPPGTNDGLIGSQTRMAQVRDNKDRRECIGKAL